MVMPALAFDVVGVHRALDLPLVVAVGAGLLEQLVDEGGLAVVDVGDDGDVAQFHVRFVLAALSAVRKMGVTKRPAQKEVARSMMNRATRYRCGAI